MDSKLDVEGITFVHLQETGESEFLNLKTATVVIQVTFPPSGSAWCPLPSAGHESQMVHLLF